MKSKHALLGIETSGNWLSADCGDGQPFVLPAQ